MLVHMNSVTQHRPHPLPHLRLVSPWLRARVWLTRQTLDHRLAHGESSLASPELARRAKQLASIRCRHSLAAGLRRVVEDAERPARTMSAAVPIQRRAILRSRLEIERLAAELDGPEPVSLAGIARVQLLLTHGNSPLYAPLPEGALDEALAHAHASLLLS
jgi:hypothetical protein